MTRVGWGKGKISWWWMRVCSGMIRASERRKGRAGNGRRKAKTLSVVTRAAGPSFSQFGLGNRSECMTPQEMVRVRDDSLTSALWLASMVSRNLFVSVTWWITQICNQAGFVMADILMVSVQADLWYFGGFSSGGSWRIFHAMYMPGRHHLSIMVPDGITVHSWAFLLRRQHQLHWT